MLRLSPALSRGASPQPLIAFQSHHPATHRKASPSLLVSVHRRCTPRLCFAVASRRFARASLPVLHGAVRCFAPPSPCLALLRLSIPLPFHVWPSNSVAGLRDAVLFSSVAALLNAKLFHRRPEQINALPLQRPSPQLHRQASPCCASPSPRRPSQSLSAAVPSKSERFLRHSSLRDAAIAIPLLRLSSRLRCMAAPGRAKPSRHGASLGSSVAVRRNAPPSRR